MTMTDPIADMLSRVRNASNAHHDTVSMPTSKLKANIADMLSRVRNASNAHHDSVSMPTSKLKASIAEIMKQEGYIADYSVEGRELSLELKYNNRERSLSGLRRVSKPGLRVYAKSTELPKVLGGLGVAIISTSQGLLTDRQAQEKGVGGEVLAYIW